MDLHPIAHLTKLTVTTVGVWINVWLSVVWHSHLSSTVRQAWVWLDGRPRNQYGSLMSQTVCYPQSNAPEPLLLFWIKEKKIRNK
jgi:hypothetical protein